MHFNTLLDHISARVRAHCIAIILALVVFLIVPRRSQAEDFLDFKVMYYQEADDRVNVWTPTFMYQQEFENGLILKIDGLYDTMSGATPTGGPATTTTKNIVRSGGSTTTTTTTTTPGTTTGGGTTTTDDDDDDDGGEIEDDAALHFKPQLRSARQFNTVSGATAISTGGGTTTGGGGTTTTTTTTGGGSTTTTSTNTTVTSTGKVPTTNFSEERYAFNIELAKKFGDQTPSAQFSLSSESDYLSLGLALRNAVEFNRKNTILQYGGAYTHDDISPENNTPKGDKNTYDALIGITQVLTPTTLFNINLSLGYVEGLLNDPYKVVQVNGILVSEKRPDNKTKGSVYASLNQFIKPLDGSIELGFRYYHDTFGIDSGTLSLAWLQKIGDTVIISPMGRYYEQTAADFYDVYFTGSPANYSSDYRLSAYRGFSYGLKLDWKLNERLSFNISYERYEQKGKDGITPESAYVKADIVVAGVRIWL